MNFLSTFFNYIRTLFLQGLFALLPITLTIAFIHFALTLAKRWLEPILRFMPKYLLAIPFIEIIFVFCFVLLIGFILNYFFIAQIAYYIDAFIDKIPFIKPIYNSIKQLVGALNTHEQGALKEVVMVEFPRKGSYALGFLTGKFPQELFSKELQLYNIFIPASPNPTSGFFIIAAESEFFVIELSRQEAMKLIISGGIIIPERFKS